MFLQNFLRHAFFMKEIQEIKVLFLKKLPSPDKGFLFIKKGQAMVQATFTIQIWVAFSPLPEELPHT